MGKNSPDSGDKSKGLENSLKMREINSFAHFYFPYFSDIVFFISLILFIGLIIFKGGLKMPDHRRSNFNTKDERLLSMKEADYPGGVVVDPTPITLDEELWCCIMVYFQIAELMILSPLRLW